MTQGANYAYEWDEAKRQRTLETRNVDFADMAFFEWDTALARTDGRRDYGEERFFDRLHQGASSYLYLVLAW